MRWKFAKAMHGLRQGNFHEKVETGAPGDTVDIVARTGCIEDGRLTGTFVSEIVVNLSNRILSKAEVGLLSKGLNFSPTPSDLDRSKLKEDIESFKRRMRLKWFFRDNDRCEDNEVITNKFKCKSSWWTLLRNS